LRPLRLETGRVRCGNTAAAQEAPGVGCSRSETATGERREGVQSTRIGEGGLLWN
jgi:hypothetical protein